MKKHKFKYTAGRALRHIVLALWCATTAFPILWTLMVSFKDNSQILRLLCLAKSCNQL